MIADPLAIRIRRTIERTPPGTVQKFEGVPTSFIADAQQGWGCMHHSIKPIAPGMRFAGVAVTSSNGPRDNLGAMAMLDVAEVGDVLIIATGQDESGAVVGDHWAAVAKQRGVAAVVTDGLVRDVEGIEALGLAVFARGVSPNAGYRNGPAQVNGPISVGAMVVNPGDVVAGDRDGVVVIPREQASAVARVLEHVIENERETEARVAAGEIKQMWSPERFAGRGVEYID